MRKSRGSADERHPGRRYELRVDGHLDRRWSQWLDGLTLSHTSDGTTVIEGELADQAALHGVLKKLRDLGVPLLSVTPIESDPPDPSGDHVRSRPTEQRQGDRNDNRSRNDGT